MRNFTKNRIVMFCLCMRKCKDAEKSRELKAKRRIAVVQKEESRIVKLDLVGIMKSGNDFYFIFEIKTDDVLSTTEISVENFNEYIKTLLAAYYPDFAQELSCKTIKRLLKDVSPQVAAKDMFESVQKISQILKRDSPIKRLIYKGPMLSEFWKEVGDTERKASKGCILFKISKKIIF